MAVSRAMTDADDADGRAAPVDEQSRVEQAAREAATARHPLSRLLDSRARRATSAWSRCWCCSASWAWPPPTRSPPASQPAHHPDLGLGDRRDHGRGHVRDHRRRHRPVGGQGDGAGLGVGARRVATQSLRAVGDGRSARWPSGVGVRAGQRRCSSPTGGSCRSSSRWPCSISAQGLAEQISGRRSQIVTDPTIAAIANTRLLGIPLLVYIFAAVVAVGWVVLNRTTFGRRTFAIGGNPEAARLAGIDVRRHTVRSTSCPGCAAASRRS